jgi:hypothetical protein
MCQNLAGHFVRPVQVEEQSLDAVLKRWEKKVKGEGPFGKAFSLSLPFSLHNSNGGSFFASHKSNQLAYRILTHYKAVFHDIT